MSKDEHPHELLERLFHEPNRLAILSALAAAERDGLTFTQLKQQCGLTDGNLNRHLAVLEEGRAIRVHKAFVDRKPRTTVQITASGLARFTDYLEALGQVLQSARAALPVPARNTAVRGGKPVPV